MKPQRQLKVKSRSKKPTEFSFFTLESIPDLHDTTLDSMKESWSGPKLPIADLSSMYYSPIDSFDVIRYLLCNLTSLKPRDLAYRRNEFQSYLSSILEQLNHVIRLHSSLIVSSSARVHDVTNILGRSLAICKNGIRLLREAKNNLLEEEHAIMQVYRKRENDILKFETLTRIRSFVVNVELMKKANHEGDYSSAIDYYHAISDASTSLSHVHLVADVCHIKYANYGRVILDELETAMMNYASSCEFRAETYEKILLGYYKMGQFQMLLGSLPLVFSSSIERACERRLYSFMMTATANDPTASTLQTSHSSLFSTLSTERSSPPSYHAHGLERYGAQVRPALYIGCLSELGKALVSLLKFYESVKEWHRQESTSTWTENDDFRAALSSLYEPLKEAQLTYHHEATRVYLSYLNTQWTRFSLSAVQEMHWHIHQMQNELEDILPGSSSELEHQCHGLYVKYWDTVHSKEMETLTTVCSEENWSVIGHAGSSYLHYWRSRIKTEREKAERQKIHADRLGLKPNSLSTSPSVSKNHSHDPFQSDSDSDASFISSASHSRSKYGFQSDDLESDLLDPTEQLQPSLSVSFMLRKLTNYYIHSCTFVEISTRILHDLMSLVEYYTFCICCFFMKDLPMLPIVKPKYEKKKSEKVEQEEIDDDNNNDSDREERKAALRANGERHAEMIDPSERILQWLEKKTQFLKSLVQQEKQAIHLPILKSSIQLNSPITLYGLAHRSLAVQSLRLLYAYMIELEPFLKETRETRPIYEPENEEGNDSEHDHGHAATPVSFKASKEIQKVLALNLSRPSLCRLMNDWYKQWIESVLQPLPSTLLSATSYLILPDIESILSAGFKRVKYAKMKSKELMIDTAHSAYVDKLLTNLIVFKDRLSAIQSTLFEKDAILSPDEPTIVHPETQTVSSNRIPMSLQNELWQIIIDRIVRSFQSHLAKIVKTSDLGRARLFIDFNEICNFLETYSGLKIESDVEAIKNRIKSFYHDPGSGTSWTTKIFQPSVQLARLISSMSTDHKPNLTE